MTSSAVLAVIASSWGVVMGLAPLLLIRKILASRSSRDVSLAFLAVYLLGFTLWLAYGASLGNIAIVVPNAVSLVIGSLALAVAFRFRPGRLAVATE